MKVITICSSASFYKDVLDIKRQLEKKGFVVEVPSNALHMEKNNDFTVERYKTWYTNKHDYQKKQALMDEHFEKVKKADAILVVNNEKHGISGYIGGNGLMEMAVAHLYKKPIYVLNDISDTLSFAEEVYGLHPIFLKGNLENMSTT